MGAALLMANPIVDKADAASNSTDSQVKVYEYKFNKVEVEQFKQQIKQYLETHMNQKPTSQSSKVQTPQEDVTTTKPVAKQPAEQQPAETSKETTDQAAYKLSEYEQQVVDLTNQERAKSGLPALKADLELSKVAREKSLDMQKNNYFSHTSPTYGSPFDMMKQFGITYRAAGENIAMGQRSPEEVVKGWMNSEGHRKNILSSNFTHIGVGYVAEGNYWTQQFIGK